MEKIRYPKEWTKEEVKELARNDGIGDYLTEATLLRVAYKAVTIATSSPPRREIEPGTLVHVSDSALGWARDGAKVGFYEGRSSEGEHMADGYEWRFTRPVAPGWKPGDPLDLPNEGDL